MNETTSPSPRPASQVVMTRRAALIGAVLAGASGIAYAREPQVTAPIIKAEEFESWVPSAFGPWSLTATSGVLLPPPDSLRDRLYDNLVTRVYTAPGKEPVMLLLAYNNAQDGVVQVHRPEVCYPVGGFELTPTEPITLAAMGKQIPANFFTANGKNRLEQVAYYTRLGSDFPRRWIEQRLSVMKANINGIIPDGMLMRASVLRVDKEVALPMLNEFTGEFIAASPAKLKALLVG